MDVSHAESESEPVVDVEMTTRVPQKNKTKAQKKLDVQKQLANARDARAAKNADAKAANTAKHADARAATAAYEAELKVLHETHRCADPCRTVYSNSFNTMPKIIGLLDCGLIIRRGTLMF